MSKVTKIIAENTDAGIEKAISRMAEHDRKIETIANRPIKKDASGMAKAAQITKKVGGISWHIGASFVDFDAIVLMWLSQAFVKASDWLFIDNEILNWLKERNTNKKIKKNKKTGKDKIVSKFRKNNPRAAAYLTWYLMLLSVVGGIGIVKNKDKIRDAAKDKIENVKEGIDKIHNTVTSKIENIKTRFGKRSKDENTIQVREETLLDPASDDFIDKCIALENITCIPVIYTETYRATPVVQPKENVWTRGFGMTWSRDSAGHMRIRDYADTPNNRKKNLAPHKPQPDANMDVSIEDSQQFLIDHVYSSIKKNMSRPMTINEFIAVCVAGYQLEGHIPTICRQLSAATTPQEVADAFITTSMYKFGGTPKRRWICGMLAAGYITINDVLNADIDAFYGPDQNTFIRDGHFICLPATIEYVMSIQRKQSTMSVVSQLSDGRVALAQIDGTIETQRIISEENDVTENISKSMKTLIAAQKKYDKADYDGAAELFQQAITEDPDNMEAYSSLAVTYKKLGDKNHSMDYYEKALQTVRDCNKRMNANKSLLYDAEVKGATYYNAGLAHEEMAKIAAQSGDMTSAKEHYSKAKKNYHTAYLNAETVENAERMGQYKKAEDRIEKVLKSMESNNSPVAFNGASALVKTRIVKQRGKTTPVLRTIRNNGRRA